MECPGEGSTSGGTDTPENSRRRRREVFEAGSEVDMDDEPSSGLELVLAGQHVPGPQGRCHRGPGPQTKFAKDWDGVNFRLAPSLHLSHRTICGLIPGNMRTFSGYTTAYERYEKLDGNVKSILLNSAFGPLIRSWKVVASGCDRSKLIVIRAFLDRFWDTTNSFHLVSGIEASYNVSGFAHMTGLPMGENMIDWNGTPPKVTDPRVVELIGRGLKRPTGNEPDRFCLIKSTLVNDYFRGKGICQVSENTPEQNARLWLWWLLGTTYFGDKGERLSTLLLAHLARLDDLGSWNWVLPALGLTFKYLRAAVRPEGVLTASAPALVGPGRIMEAWIFAHFKCIQTRGAPVPTTYPAFEGAKVESDDFIPDPWSEYTGVPAGVRATARSFDCRRLYVGTPFGSVWILGERVARQSVRTRFVVPADPPRILFVKNPSREERLAHGEGGGEGLLYPEMDYTTFARERLVMDTIERGDPDVAVDLPFFPEVVEYTYAGREHPLAAPAYTPVVTNSGTEDWGVQLRKVTGASYLLLWSMANRWRNLASELMTRLRQKEDELMERDRIIAERDRIIAELRHAR